MHQENTDQKNAADNFAALLKNLAVNGQIESLSITIRAWSSDDLFQLAQSLGIKEVCVTAQFV